MVYVAFTPGVVYGFVLGQGSIADVIKAGSATADGGLSNLEKFAAFVDFSREEISLSSR